METRRFRNHFTIIIEQVFKTLAWMIMITFWALLDQLEELGALLDGGMNLKDRWIYLVLAAVLAFEAGVVLLKVFAWAKTYITIDEKTLTVDKDTLIKKKDTIGIKNISNVNVEQSVLERIFGTMAVKIDTNTLSTANSNDVRIVLKKEHALELKDGLLKRMEQYREDYAVSDKMVKEGAAPSSLRDEEIASAPLSKVMLHGIFSMRIIALAVVITTLGAGIFLLVDQFARGEIGRGIGAIVLSVAAVLTMFFSASWNLIKGFIRYCDFGVKREDRQIFLKYGLLKKVSYVLPLDKINAVKIVQTPIARIFKRYAVEVVNIGLGDETDTEQAILVLYCRKEELRRKMQLLLPEYAQICDLEIAKQPREVWVLWGLQGGITLGLCIMIGWIIGSRGDTVLNFQLMIALGCGLITAVLTLVLNYRTRGVVFGENKLFFTQGHMQKTSICIDYRNIQYVRLHQNPVTKKRQIVKGDIHLLASKLNVAQVMPYFYEKDVEQFKKRLNSNVL